MVACHTPSLRNLKEVLRELRECRTFAFGTVMGAGADEIERLCAGLQKIADKYPCATADDMSRVARETLGLLSSEQREKS